MATDDRGFGSMPKEKVRKIASEGGQSQGQEDNPGNFANDRQKAQDAGRQGGKNSRGNQDQED